MNATPAAEYVFQSWSGATGSSSSTSLVMSSDKSVTANFVKKKYTLTTSVEGEGTVTEKVIKAGAATDYNSGTIVELTAVPSDEWEFVEWKGDVTGTENPKQITIDKAKSVTAVFEDVQTIEIINSIDTLVISRKHKFEVIGKYSNGNNIDLTSLISLEITDDKVTLLEENEFTVGKSGETSINIKYNDIEISETFYVNYFEEVLFEQGDYLNENQNNSNINVPIVIINFHPTLDGFNIDPRRYVDVSWNLEMYKIRSKEIHMFTKFGIEEGSKFRGYKNNSSEKSINVQVVKYYNFYKLKTKVYGSRTTPQPDYQEIFDIINLKSLVNDMGVIEVWFSIPPLDIEYPAIQQGLISKEFLLNMGESNMSSYLGDVSNNNGDQSDLPIYDNQYVVYGINVDRGPSESLHNRGHQIERQFRHIEKDKRFGEELFWNKFVGTDQTDKPIGRCGMTHFPPNTNVDYDYCNDTLVESDIKNWNPQGGEKELVSCNTWTGINYDYPFTSIFWDKNNISKDSGYKWFIYWFQSIPGNNNNILYERDGKNYNLTNWWDLYYNWNDSLENNKTLWD
ncbi:hypothetical protein OAC93_01440 [Flavobacteriaceae bacterium]|nr:hypothetical protein [Flavobacteriaceae bacterium]